MLPLINYIDISFKKKLMYKIKGQIGENFTLSVGL